MRIPARPLSVAAACLFLSAALTGCEDIFNAIIDSPAPTGVTASDGEYADSIYVSWTAPSLSSDKWKDHTVSSYRVSWSSDADSGSYWTTSTSYTIHVDPANRAKEYSVTVETFLSPSGSGSASDTGFALDTKPLIWPDEGASYTVSGADQWYVTMLQRGFAYRFDFTPGTGVVEFYPFKTLDLDHAEAAAAAPTWTCDEEGKNHKFFIRVQPGAPGDFTAKCDLGYGF
jgi:hypothetical protein